MDIKRMIKITLKNMYLCKKDEVTLNLYQGESKVLILNFDWNEKK